MNSQHRFPTRNFRPDPQAEYGPAEEIADAAGHSMSHVLRALLRLLVAEPDRTLRKLKPHLAAVKEATPKGRPRPQADDQPSG